MLRKVFHFGEKMVTSQKIKETYWSKKKISNKIDFFKSKDRSNHVGSITMKIAKGTEKDGILG